MPSPLKLTSFVMSCILISASIVALADDDDDLNKKQSQNGSAPKEADQNDDIELNAAQSSLINLQVEILNAKTIDRVYVAPGEVTVNADTAYLVSTSVDATIEARHMSLGDMVEKSQPLITLFSADVAAAQAQYLVDQSEWERVKGLGSKAVGQNRFVTAETQYKASYARLLAFGLSERAILKLKGDTSSLGQYTLYASVAGRVLSDSYQLGQRISAGEPLIQISDGQTFWVLAHLPSVLHFSNPLNASAVVNIEEANYPAKIIQQAHSLDERTRTREVRLLLEDTGDKLFPGQFVDVTFTVSSEKPVIAVPESALMRGSDGDWTIYIEESPGQFSPKEVQLGQSYGDLQEIIGVASGTRVVIRGAFYLASELAKSNFADDD